MRATIKKFDKKVEQYRRKMSLQNIQNSQRKLTENTNGASFWE